MILDIIKNDKSIIARDSAVIAVANYTRTSIQAAAVAYPYLKIAMMVHKGRHAHHAMRGLEFVGMFMPDKKEDIIKLTQNFISHSRGVVRKAAKALIRTLEAS